MRAEGPAERRLLWFFVVALLAVDVVLLVQRGRLVGSLRDLRARSGLAMIESAYADEEEALLTRTRTVPATFLGVRAGAGGPDALLFVLVVSVDDCTNCIEDEIVKLNEIAITDRGREVRVVGYFVDEERSEIARRFIDHLAPSPLFDVSIENALVELPGATTPLVLVVRPHDRKILDVHKPLPQNFARRDAFYARWLALAGLG